MDFSPFKTKFLALKKIDQSAEDTVKQMYALSIFTSPYYGAKRGKIVAFKIVFSFAPFLTFLKETTISFFLQSIPAILHKLLINIGLYLYGITGTCPSYIEKWQKFNFQKLHII